LAATVDMAPGEAEVPLLLGGERPKRSESFPEKEARRLEGEEGIGGGEFSLLDIAM